MADLIGWTLSRPSFFTKYLSAKKGTNNFGSQDLITVNNEICYIWRSENRTIIRTRCSDIWRNGRKVEDPNGAQLKEYSTAPIVAFEPTRIEARYSPRTGELVLLWCPSGFAVVKLDTLASKATESLINPKLKLQSGSTPAVSVFPDERVYMEHPGLRILQAKWFPTSGHDIIVVLNNDNYLRCYLLSRPETHISMICLGPEGSVPFHYSSYSVGLVEAPIDVDFGPELSSTGYNTLFVLQESGEVSYLLIKYMPTTYQFHWHKPTELVLDSDDIEDCFQDATAILVSKTFPVVVIVGTTSGKLHHAVLLPTDEENTEPSAVPADVNMEEGVLNGNVILFVKEVVEIEPEDDEVGLSLMKLLPDPLHGHRYACVHGEGVHIISMNFLARITPLFAPARDSAAPSSLDLTVLDAVNGNSSKTEASVRFVVKCKLFRGGIDKRQKQNAYKSNFTFSDSIPQKFVLILGDYGTVVYEIPYMLSGSALESESQTPTDEGDGAKGSSQLKAIDMIQTILKKSVNQPLLLRQAPKDSSGDGGGDSSKDFEGRDLITDALRTLRRQYVLKQEQAVSHLSESLSTISLDTKELNDLMATFMMKDLTEIKTTAARLSQEYKAVSAKEDELQKRLEAILTAHNDQLPVLTDEEKRWLTVLDKLEAEVESMQEMVKELRIRVTNPLLAQGQDTMQEIIRPERFSEPQLNTIRLKISRQQRILANLKNSMMNIRKSLPNT